MPRFEQPATPPNADELLEKARAEEQARKDQIQVIAGTKYAEQNSGEDRRGVLPSSEDYIGYQDEPGIDKLGPPNPENYKQAEVALNQLLDSVEDERKWGIIGEFSQKAMIILGGAPVTLGLVLKAIMESNKKPYLRKALGKKERVSFVESLREEWNKSAVSPKVLWSSASERPATEILDDVNEVAKELKDARNRSDSDEVVQLSPEELQKLKNDYVQLIREWIAATEAFDESVKSGKGASGPGVMNGKDFSALTAKIAQIGDKLKSAGLSGNDLDALNGFKSE